ncbi:MAG: menaquinone biosynthesis protein [Fimbriimonadaceae bacterium]|nr:menaquinone biosynthesis protein [Fimbriimonadaceae bacterium]
MRFRVGSVPFVNAKPLVAWFESLGEVSPVAVEYDLPSRLPRRLDDGAVDAILVSSIDLLTQPDRRAAAGVCIGSYGPAASVRLFSKTPIAEIASLALDASSMTSNALARLLLQREYGVTPRTELCQPDLPAMLSTHDAAVLIGNKGLAENAEGAVELDLGDEWTRATGLPFVWALWVGDENLVPELAAYLEEAFRWSRANFSQVCLQAAETSGWDLETCERYLGETMRYELGEREVEGLRLYGSLLKEFGIAESVYEPTFVHPTAVGAASSP